MKRYGNIYDKIYDIDNLREAHRNARKDKLFYKEVKMVDSNPDFYLMQVQEMLKNKTYEVSPYIVSTIVDKGKERVLSKLPYFPDRIIQWAIMLQIEKIFNEVFTNFTCASLNKRGIHYASKLVDKCMLDKFGTQYCLKIDINKFYPNINHTILKNLLRKKIKDLALLELLDKIIDSIPGDTGIPIGSYLSQYLANFYLAYFDHWLKEVCEVKYIIRYMDDVVILHESKEFLHDLRCKMNSYLRNELKLTIKSNWQVFPTATRGIDFVGYRHFYGYKLLRKRTCKRFKRKMLNILNKIKKGGYISYSDWCAGNSYNGWLIWCNGYRLTVKYIKPLKPYFDDYYKSKIKGKVVTS